MKKVPRKFEKQAEISINKNAKTKPPILHTQRGQVELSVQRRRRSMPQNVAGKALKCSFLLCCFYCCFFLFFVLFFRLLNIAFTSFAHFPLLLLPLFSCFCLFSFSTFSRYKHVVSAAIRPKCLTTDLKITTVLVPPQKRERK